MIPKNKIEKYAVEYALQGKGYSYKLDGFEAGVSFAQKELGNLAIEFAEWIGENFYKNYRDKDDSFWMNSKKLIVYTTKELFEIFKKEKYEYEY